MLVVSLERRRLDPRPCRCGLPARVPQIGPGAITSAYSAATELIVLSLIVLVAMTILGSREDHDQMRIDAINVTKNFGEVCRSDRGIN